MASSTASAPARKKTVTRKKRAAPAPVAITTITHAQIAKQAYLLWLEKGQPAGMDDRIWREAESVLTEAMA